MATYPSPSGYTAIAACLLSLLPATAQAEDFKDHLIKAGFIYNFVKFVEWPGEREIAKQSNIDICVMGESPLNDAGSVFRSASTPKLNLSLVKEQSWHNAAKHCHVLFISDTEAGKLADILAGLRNQPVLTVSDMDEFAQKGGMIGFININGSVKLVVNKRSAEDAGLRIDAQLLEISAKVLGK